MAGIVNRLAAKLGFRRAEIEALKAENEWLRRELRSIRNAINGAPADLILRPADVHKALKSTVRCIDKILAYKVEVKPNV